MLPQNIGHDAAPSQEESAPPTHRELYDRLCGVLAMPLCRYSVTIRSSPRRREGEGYDPQRTARSAERIGQSLKDAGCTGLLFPAFRSIKTRRKTALHFHALTVDPPPDDWTEAHRERHGPRSVHVQEIRPNAERLAHYIAQQAIALVAVAPHAVKALPLGDLATLDDAPEMPENLGNKTAADEPEAIGPPLGAVVVGQFTGVYCCVVPSPVGSSSTKPRPDPKARPPPSARPPPPPAYCRSSTPVAPRRKRDRESNTQQHPKTNAVDDPRADA